MSQVVGGLVRLGLWGLGVIGVVHLVEEVMAKRIFISFDYEKDRNYAHLIQAWKANPKFDLYFKDCTATEINSNDYGRIKGVLTQKIQSATHILVIVGVHATKPHPRQSEIGESNWQTWELKKALALKKKVIVVKLDRSYGVPDAAYSQGAGWANAFTFDAVLLSPSFCFSWADF